MASILQGPCTNQVNYSLPIKIQKHSIKFIWDITAHLLQHWLKHSLGKYLQNHVGQIYNHMHPNQNQQKQALWHRGLSLRLLGLQPLSQCLGSSLALLLIPLPACVPVWQHTMGAVAAFLSHTWNTLIESLVPNFPILQSQDANKRENRRAYWFFF